MIKAIGTAARRELDGARHALYLALRVDVRRRWRTDDALLDRLASTNARRAPASAR